QRVLPSLHERRASDLTQAARIELVKILGGAGLQAANRHQRYAHGSVHRPPWRLQAAAGGPLRPLREQSPPALSRRPPPDSHPTSDRKSTRLNSSHVKT